MGRTMKKRGNGEGTIYYSPTLKKMGRTNYVGYI